VRLRFRVRTAPSQESGGQLDRVVDVEPAGDEVRIGRRAGLEIQLPFGTISSLHARVVRHGKGWALLDMGSVNGTFVGESRLQVGIPRVISPGDVIKLADVVMVFDGESGVAAAPPMGTESTATIARRLVNDLFQAVAGAEVAKVIVESGTSAGKSVALSVPDRAYKVGRAPDCDLVLSDDAISREHAAFERRWQGVFVKDLGSKNGIEVEGKKVKGEQRVHDGQLVTVGSIKLKVDDPEERYLKETELAKEAAGRKLTPAISPGAAAPAAAAVKPAAPPATGGAAAAARPAPGGASLPGAAAPAKPAAAAAVARPTPAASPAAKEPAKPAKPAKPLTSRGAAAVSHLSQKIDQLGERTSRVLPFFVTVFSLAVLGGVAYLVYLMFFGMDGGAAP
jgi:pSer/pThr/pTyr-binding forkhead associated (FHA) protein